MKFVNDYIENNICTYVVLKKSIDDCFRKLFIRFYAIINFNVFDKVFIDRFFAQKLNLKLIFLKNFCVFETFNKFEAVCDFIIYYVNVFFKKNSIKEDYRLIRFYVTDFFY